MLAEFVLAGLAMIIIKILMNDWFDLSAKNMAQSLHEHNLRIWEKNDQARADGHARAMEVARLDRWAHTMAPYKEKRAREETCERLDLWAQDIASYRQGR